MKVFYWFLLLHLSTFSFILWAQNQEQNPEGKQPDEVALEQRIKHALNQLQNSVTPRQAYLGQNSLIPLGEKAVPALLEAIKDPKVNIDLQLLLMETLSLLKSEKAVPFFKESAESSHPWIRYYALMGLASVQKEQETVENALTSPDLTVKEGALRALAGFKPTWEKTPQSVLEVLETE